MAKIDDTPWKPGELVMTVDGTPLYIARSASDLIVKAADISIKRIMNPWLPEIYRLEQDKGET